MRPTESAVLVPLPEAEPAVGRFRARLDRSAGSGVPAHLTVLYPFRAPDELNDRVLAELAAAVATVPAFDVALARTAWFDDQVLWLAPEPDQPFRDLTSAVHHRFPDCPPYRGAYSDVVPHLTVGHDAPDGVLRRAAARRVSCAWACSTRARGGGLTGRARCGAPAGCPAARPPDRR